MKFKTYFIGFCLVLFVNQTLSESIKNLADDIVLPVALKLLPAFMIPPPAGPIIMAGLGFMQICSGILDSKKTNTPSETNVKEAYSQLDLMEVQSAIMDGLKTVDMHLLQESERIIRELTLEIETNGFFEALRQTVDYLQRTFADKMKVVIDSKANGPIKRITVHDMLNYSSDYRNILRSFISKFIKPNVNGLLLLKPVKLFFEFILEKEKLLAAKEDDCSSDSLNNKIYKSFVYILKVLTDGYVMAVSAHVAQYQEALQNNTLSDAEELKENAIILINEYKNDAESLIEAAKSALDKAPREIRNCGKFKLEEGKSFERISFSHMIPNIKFLKFIDIFEYKCMSANQYVKWDDYEFGKCNDYTEDIPFGSKLSISIELKKQPVDRTPFSYMKFIRPDETKEEYGRNRSQFTLLQNSLSNPECYTTFCSAYRKKLYAISTQRVSAEPGNVITGLRFRVTNRVIYIDIQQGKFVDLVTVDPKTVVWTETPESNQIAYLDSKLRKFELGDFVLKDNSILTSIQLKNTILPNGLIRVFIDGLTPPHMNNTDSMSYVTDDLEIHELELIDADNPKFAGDLTKNLISKPPIADKRYFVSFQPSDFKKEFGQSTVPLLDTREVVSNPPAPLNGIGLYHESFVGSGGLIAMKLITPNLHDLFEPLKNKLIV